MVEFTKNPDVPRIFVYADDEQAHEAFKRARAWIDQPDQKQFASPDLATVAIRAVTEFILNEKGFTLYKVNAKYPKRLGMYP